MKDEVWAGAYSYMALSEPIVIITGVQQFVRGLGMTPFIIRGERG